MNLSQAKMDVLSHSIGKTILGVEAYDHRVILKFENDLSLEVFTTKESSPLLCVCYFDPETKETSPQA